MKTEPDTFSFEDLVRAPRHVTSWEGVRNYQARNLMRDEFKLGDLVFIYHSSCDEPGVIGTAEVVRESYPDMSALNLKSEYFDEKSARDGASRWMMVDVQAKTRFTAPVTLKAMRALPGLDAMLLLKKGSRLSVQPVTAKEWAIIVKAGKPKPI